MTELLTSAQGATTGVPAGTPAPAPAPGVARTEADVVALLRDLASPVFAVADADGVGLSAAVPAGATLLAAAGPVLPERLGDPAFLAAHGVRYPYLAGAMAGGIASEDMVIALAREGFLASFGAAGLLPERIDAALRRFAAEIPGLPFACNLIHAPSEERLERESVEAFLRHGVRCVEASAYLKLTSHIVRYRVAGLSRGADGAIVIGNRVVAKISRAEIAELFLRPAPRAILDQLVAGGFVTAEQAALAASVPMADDVTVEADSGGHTDRRPMPALFPTILRLRDRICAEQGYAVPVRVGAAGGIATPEATLAAFTMGAAYVVTGSVNQACIESGACEAAKALLATAGVADVAMAPAADMFEMGVELQVLRRGTMFPGRARRLYELWREYPGIHALPPAEREKLETQVFRRSLDDVWAETRDYFARRDPDQLARAEGDPKRRMALVFRWYLGMSSRWSVTGQDDRTADYQIWCGPAMGAFNDWAAGTYLAEPGNRRVADVGRQLLAGAAYLARVEALRLAGVALPSTVRDFRPQPDGGTT